MSQYTVYVVPDEFNAIKKLPGNVRQRVRRALDELADNPRPSNSKQLDVSDREDVDCEIRRWRIDDWRVVYTVSEEDKAIDVVVAVRKRPPYDYGDLAELLGDQPDDP